MIFATSTRLLLLLLLTRTTVSASKYFEFITPNNRTAWIRNDVQTVAWKIVSDDEVQSPPNVTLWYAKVRSAIEWKIIATIPNEGRYEWKIETELGTHRLRVCGTEDCVTKDKRYPEGSNSDAFTVYEPGSSGDPSLFANGASGGGGSGILIVLVSLLLIF